LFSAAVVVVHGAQCTVSSPTASDPCCTALSNDVTYVTYLTLVEAMITTTPQTYYSCLETNADDSVAGQNNQAGLVDVVTSVIDSHNCWGGDIAQAPGNNVHSVPSRQDFARQLQSFACQADYTVDGDWGGPVFCTPILLCI